MNNKENITKGYDRKELVVAIISAVKAVTIGAKNIQKAAENIETACHTHGTKGAAHKDELLTKADNLRKLAALYNSAVKRLMNIVSKLTGDVPDNKVLNELIMYGQFLVDQLKSEEDEARRILDMLQKE